MRSNEIRFAAKTSVRDLPHRSPLTRSPNSREKIAKENSKARLSFLSDPFALQFFSVGQTDTELAFFSVSSAGSAIAGRG